METNTLQAVGFGMIAAVGWGISGFFDARASKTVGPLASAFLINTLIAMLYAVVFCVFWRPLTVNISGIWFAASSGVVITLGALAYFKGLSIGPVSLVSPMSSVYPFVTTLLALFVFNTHMRPRQLTGVVLIIIGAMFATTITRPKQLRALESRGPLLGLGAAICWGTGYTLLAQAVSRLGWQSATFFEFAAMAIAFGVCIPAVNDGKFVSFASIMSGAANKSVLMASSIAFCAALSFNIGLAHEAASGAIIAAISACYPVLTSLLALRHFDERVARVPLLGAATSVTGVILILVL